MLVLFESAAGLALLKVLDEKKLKDVTKLQECFESGETAKKLLKLKAFSKFDNTAEALATAAALVDSKLSKGAKKFLKKHVVDKLEGKEQLAVADAKLGNLIKQKLGVPCVHSAAVMELLRGVRTHLSDVVTKLGGVDMRPIHLGLSHSLSRFKLKFSPDKVDTMIVQAIGLLDELDKELNTYAMRTREWYGWHFPEMTKIVSDNIEYAKAAKLMGTRDTAASIDFSGILNEEVEAELKEAAIVSMGTDISEEDVLNIKHLCDQVVSLSEYRAQLYDYLRSRMQAIAPNLTVLVGELVGARLISHAGSLMSLAKHPASTVQILGAEKALFRALKTKHETPKYGLIYHASLIGQAAPKFKGKISRVLAAKCSLSIRMDALGETSEPTVGIENRAKVRIHALRYIHERHTKTRCECETHTHTHTHSDTHRERGRERSGVKGTPPLWQSTSGFCEVLSVAIWGEARANFLCLLSCSLRRASTPRANEIRFSSKGYEHFVLLSCPHHHHRHHSLCVLVCTIADAMCSSIVFAWYDAFIVRWRRGFVNWRAAHWQVRPGARAELRQMVARSQQPRRPRSPSTSRATSCLRRRRRRTRRRRAMTKRKMETTARHPQRRSRRRRSARRRRRMTPMRPTHLPRRRRKRRRHPSERHVCACVCECNG